MPVTDGSKRLFIDTTKDTASVAPTAVQLKESGVLKAQSQPTQQLQQEQQVGHAQLHPSTSSIGTMDFHDHAATQPASPPLAGSPTTVTTATTTNGSVPTSPLQQSFPPIFSGNGHALGDMNLMNFSSFPNTSVAIPPSGSDLGTSLSTEAVAEHAANPARRAETTLENKRKQTAQNATTQPQKRSKKE